MANRKSGAQSISLSAKNTSESCLESCTAACLCPSLPRAAAQLQSCSRVPVAIAVMAGQSPQTREGGRAAREAKAKVAKASGDL